MNLLAELIDLCLPERCAGCGRSPIALCDICAIPLKGPARPAGTAPAGLPPPWTVATYEGPLRAILSAYKERGRTALAVPLGEALATALQAAITPLDPPHTVVWVPSRNRARRRRGHDPVRETVAVALHRLRADGVPATAVNALRHRAQVTDQAGLTATQRATNLKGALEATRKIPTPVILVDDLITTGATLTEATRALTTAGTQVTATATIATTPRHHP